MMLIHVFVGTMKPGIQSSVLHLGPGSTIIARSENLTDGWLPGGTTTSRPAAGPCHPATSGSAGAGMTTALLFPAS